MNNSKSTDKEGQEKDPKPKPKIKCPRPDCQSTGEFRVFGQDRQMTIVDENGNVKFHKQKTYYKCMACGATFESDIEPLFKKVMHG